MKTTSHRNQGLQQKARGLLQQGRARDALAAARKACRHQPSNADAWLLQAAVHAQLQDYGQVVECCLKVLQLQPDNAAASFNLGLAYQYTAKLDAARDAYQRSVDLNPGYTGARINLAAMLGALGETSAALHHAEAALASAPDLPAAHCAKGRALLQNGQGQEALDCLQAAQGRFGYSADIAYQIALCHQASGEEAKAQELLLQLTRSAPEFAPAWSELGHIERKAERFAKAAHYYEHATRLQPALETRFHLAHCLYAADHIEAARELYLELLAQDPNNLLILNNLGRLYERIGQSDVAEKHYRKAVALQPDHAVPHSNLGRALLNQEQYADAKQEFEQAVLADPEDFHGYFGLGQALCELGEHQSAIDAFQQAVDLKEELVEAHYYIASLRGEINGDVQQKYVTDLFDRFAEKFDDHLVKDLKYRTPQAIYDAVTAATTTDRSDYTILDLGCGTGLCGPLFHPIAKHMVGVDLSSKMVDKARELDLYDELAVDDVTEFMRNFPRSYDLILAADVFVYLGDLSDTFRAAFNSLENSSLFAFSTETCSGSSFTLRKSGRHTHGREYVQQLAVDTGFSVAHQTDCDLRLENGKPVLGTIYVLQKRD